MLIRLDNAQLVATIFYEDLEATAIAQQSRERAHNIVTGLYGRHCVRETVARVDAMFMIIFISSLLVRFRVPACEKKEGGKFNFLFIFVYFCFVKYLVYLILSFIDDGSTMNVFQSSLRHLTRRDNRLMCIYIQQLLSYGTL